MSTESKTWYIAQRGELLAQEFLVELGAFFLASLEQADIGIDYMAFFEKDKEKIVTIGIEIKATEREVNNKYTMSSSVIIRLQSLNIPVLVIVSNVKNNEIFFNWARDLVPPEKQDFLQQSICTVRLRKSTFDEKENLIQEIFSY
jgi:hypothetical protein